MICGVCELWYIAVAVWGSCGVLELLHMGKLGSEGAGEWEGCGLGEWRFWGDLTWGSCDVWESGCLGVAVDTLSLLGCPRFQQKIVSKIHCG